MMFRRPHGRWGPGGEPQGGAGDLEAGGDSCRRGRARDLGHGHHRAIDKKAQTVTIRGPEGNAETIEVKNPKDLEGVKVGDLVDVTYARALGVALDKLALKSTR